jgi:hypothetical protein
LPRLCHPETTAAARSKSRRDFRNIAAPTVSDPLLLRLLVAVKQKCGERPQMPLSEEVLASDDAPTALLQVVKRDITAVAERWYVPVGV